MKLLSPYDDAGDIIQHLVQIHLCAVWLHTG